MGDHKLSPSFPLANDPTVDSMLGLHDGGRFVRFLGCCGLGLSGRRTGGRHVPLRRHPARIDGRNPGAVPLAVADGGAAAVLWLCRLSRRSFLCADFSRRSSLFLFWFHVAATMVLGTLAVALDRFRSLPLWCLRAAELATFGLPAAFLGVLQYFITLNSCREGVLDFPEGTWLILIYTYAMFIPNTLRRAAMVLADVDHSDGPAIRMMWYYPVMAKCVTWDQITELTLVFIAAGFGSVVVSASSDPCGDEPSSSASGRVPAGERSASAAWARSIWLSTNCSSVPAW